MRFHLKMDFVIKHPQNLQDKLPIWVELPYRSLILKSNKRKLINKLGPILHFAQGDKFSSYLHDWACILWDKKINFHIVSRSRLTKHTSYGNQWYLRIFQIDAKFAPQQGTSPSTILTMSSNASPLITKKTTSTQQLTGKQLLKKTLLGPCSQTALAHLTPNHLAWQDRTKGGQQSWLENSSNAKPQGGDLPSRTKSVHT